MLNDNVLERSELAVSGGGSSNGVPALRNEPKRHPRRQEVTAREDPVLKVPALPSETEGPLPRTGERPRNSLFHRRPIVSAIGAAFLASALGGGYVYLDYARHFQSTDDAFVAARQSSLAPKVSGYLTAVPVTDNQHVKAGDVIARIDDRDYRTALEQAEAQIAAAKASIENIDAQFDVQSAQISANQAQVDQAQAALVFAQQQAARYEHLEQTGYGSVQNAQQYSSQLHQQQAAVASAQATLKLAQRQMEALKAQRNSALANLAQAKAQRDQAQLNLSYTTLTAAQPGRVVNLSAAVSVV